MDLPPRSAPKGRNDKADDDQRQDKAKPKNPADVEFQPSRIQFYAADGTPKPVGDRKQRVVVLIR